MGDRRGDPRLSLGPGRVSQGRLVPEAVPGRAAGRGALEEPWSSQKIQFILMPWKCLCQHIYSFIVKKPISFCFLLLWEFIPLSDLQYKSAFLTEIDTAYMKSSVCLWARRSLPLGRMKDGFESKALSSLRR